MGDDEDSDLGGFLAENYDEIKGLKEKVAHLESVLKVKDIRLQVLEEFRCVACKFYGETMGLVKLGEWTCPRQTINAAIPCPGENIILERLKKEPGRAKPNVVVEFGGQCETPSPKPEKDPGFDVDNLKRLPRMKTDEELAADDAKNGK